MGIINPSGAAIGYRGLFYITTNDNLSFALPCSGEGLQLVSTLIAPDDNIHGSGNDATAFKIHYAEGQETYVGDINFPFYCYADLWTFLKKWMLTDRVLNELQTSVTISPDYIDGTNGSVFKYDGVYVTEFTITNGGANNLITVTLRLAAKSRTPTTLPTISSTTPYGEFITRQSELNKRPTPYWQSKVEDYESFNPVYSGVDVLSWTVTVNHSTITTHVLNLSRAPKSINQSLISVTGNVVLWSPSGVPEPTTRSGKLTMKIFDGSANPFATIAMTNVGLSTYPNPLRGPRERVSRTLNFEAFAGNYSAPGGEAAITLT